MKDIKAFWSVKGFPINSTIFWIDKWNKTWSILDFEIRFWRATNVEGIYGAKLVNKKLAKL